MRLEDSAALPPHQLLGVAPSASLGDVKRAFREQALRWHPDKRPRQETEDEARAARDRFVAVHTAFRSLSKRAKLHHAASVPCKQPQPPVVTRAVPASRPDLVRGCATSVQGRTTSRRFADAPEADKFWGQCFAKRPGQRGEPNLASRGVDGTGPPQVRKRRRRSLLRNHAQPRPEAPTVQVPSGARTCEEFDDMFKTTAAACPTRIATSASSSHPSNRQQVSSEARAAFAHAASRMREQVFSKHDGIAAEKQAPKVISRVEELMASNGISTEKQAPKITPRVEIPSSAPDNVACPKVTPNGASRVSDQVSDDDSDNSANEYAEGLGCVDRRGLQPERNGFGYEFHEHPREEYFEQPRQHRMPHLSRGRFLRRCSRKFNSGVTLSQLEQEEQEDEAEAEVHRRSANTEKLLAAVQRRQVLRDAKLAAGNAAKAGSCFRPPTVATPCHGANIGARGPQPAGSLSETKRSAPHSSWQAASTPVATAVSRTLPASFATAPRSRVATPAVGVPAKPAAASGVAPDVDLIRSHAFSLSQLAGRFASGIFLDSDVAQALSIFERLRRMKITETVLRETQIGSELNKKVWRAHKSKLLAKESTLLVKQWRSAFYAERAAVKERTKERERSKRKDIERPIPSPSRGTSSTEPIWVCESQI